LHRQGKFFPTQLQRESLRGTQSAPYIPPFRDGARKTLVYGWNGKGLVTSQDEKVTMTIVYMATIATEEETGFQPTVSK
jgi:hypothetical protein